jgi:hypothetical protein
VNRGFREFKASREIPAIRGFRVRLGHRVRLVQRAIPGPLDQKAIPEPPVAFRFRR